MTTHLGPPAYAYREDGLGAYHAAERHVLFTAQKGRTQGTRLVICCHGTAENARAYMDNVNNYESLVPITSRGMTCLAIDHGNALRPDNWGNNTSRDRIAEAIVWAGNTLGCLTDKVSVIANSASGASALNWARIAPNQVGSIIMRAAVSDVQAIYATGNVILVPLIDAAYDDVGGGWPVAKTTNDPMLNLGGIIPHKDRILVLYGDADGLVPPSQHQAFAAATGCSIRSVGNFDHGDVVSNADSHAVARFIKSRFGD